MIAENKNKLLIFMKAQALVWIVVALFALLFIGVIANSDPKPAPTITRSWAPDNFDAYTMAKKFITDRLKAPSTAEFASIHQSTVSQSGNNEWKVSSYVDSQNGFGAMIRTKFTISMMVNRETKMWQVLEIETDP